MQKNVVEVNTIRLLYFHILQISNSLEYLYLYLYPLGVFKKALPFYFIASSI